MSDELPHIISLGAGVQSSTMALMAACGEITPMPSCAVFADTQAEPPSVYRWLEWLTRELPFPVHVVTAGSLTDAAGRVQVNARTGTPYYSNMLPAFVLGPAGIGQVSRRCTYNFKIVPINKAVRKLARVQRGQKHVGVIQWIGISLDELQRMKPSRELWSEFRWPLIERRMSRQACLEWMSSRGYPTPPRSACVYCPFHSNTEWRRLRDEEPAAFAEAVRVEHELQHLHASISANGKINGTPFLHRSCVPLESIAFLNDADRGQLHLWDDECTGMCGV